MPRGFAFVALALTSCGAILGLEEPAFLGDDGGVVPMEGGVPENDAGVPLDGANDVSTADGPLPPTRLREITFEDGFAVGGLTGASFASSTTIQTPGLRGTYAAKTGGASSFIRWDAPGPQQELYITFRWRWTLVSNADRGTMPQIMRIFRADGQPVVELSADANERLVLRLGAQQTTPSPGFLGPGSDVRVGVHIRAGGLGIAQVHFQDSTATQPFGKPYAELMGAIDPPTGFSLGSQTALGTTPFREVLLDDVIIDTEKLVVY